MTSQIVMPQDGGFSFSSYHGAPQVMADMMPSSGNMTATRITPTMTAMTRTMAGLDGAHGLGQRVLSVGLGAVR
jgi:hypothetical protein